MLDVQGAAPRTKYYCASPRPSHPLAILPIASDEELDPGVLDLDNRVRLDGQGCARRCRDDPHAQSGRARHDVLTEPRPSCPRPGRCRRRRPSHGRSDRPRWVCRSPVPSRRPAPDVPRPYAGHPDDDARVGVQTHRRCSSYWSRAICLRSAGSLPSDTTWGAITSFAPSRRTVTTSLSEVGRSVSTSARWSSATTVAGVRAAMSMLGASSFSATVRPHPTCVAR